MRFHLIDHIESWRPWETITAHKLTSHAEAIWRRDADGEPHMAPALVLESLCQAGAWLLILSSENRQRATLASLGFVRFTGRVAPGETVSLEGRIDSHSDDAVMFSGVAHVHGRHVLAASEILCALFPGGELEDPATTSALASVLTRTRT